MLAISGAAQISPSWSTDLGGKVSWHRVTASGSYLVASEAGLSAYDQASGKMLWTINDLGSVSEEQVTELGGSPLLMSRLNDNVSVIDPFSGAVLFNSRKQNITELVYQTFLPRSNSVVVAGRTSDETPVIVSFNAGTGSVNWRLTEKFGRIIAINEVNAKELIITTLFNVYKLNSVDGSVIWKNSTSRGDALADSPLGVLVQGLAEEMSKDMEFNIRYYQSSAEDAFVLASEVVRTITLSDGKTQDSFSNTYQAFRMSTGKPIWGKEISMQGKLGDLAFFKGGVIALPDDGNKTIINYYPLAEGAEGQWGKKGKGTKIKGGVYRHVPVAGGLLLVSRSGSTTFLDVLDPATGEMRYDKPVKVDGQVARTMDTPKGVLYITSDEANIIDPATGVQVLGKSIPTNPSLTVIEGNALFVFDLKASQVKKVDLTSAAVSDFGPAKIKFEGKESATHLELRDGKVLVTSDQNLVLLGTDGGIVYQAHHQAPKESGVRKALLYAQAVRAAYIGANAYAASSALQSVETDDAVAGAMVEGVGMAYQEIGDQASDFMKQSVAQAQTRAKATAQGRDFNIVLGATGKTNSLLKVNKETGKVDASINLGDDKDPKYAVDDVTSRVFLLNGNTLEMYQL